MDTMILQDILGDTVSFFRKGELVEEYYDENNVHVIHIDMAPHESEAKIEKLESETDEHGEQMYEWEPGIPP